MEYIILLYRSLPNSLSFEKSTLHVQSLFHHSKRQKTLNKLIIMTILLLVYSKKNSQKHLIF